MIRPQLDSLLAVAASTSRAPVSWSTADELPETAGGWRSNLRRLLTSCPGKCSVTTSVVLIVAGRLAIANRSLALAPPLTASRLNNGVAGSDSSAADTVSPETFVSEASVETMTAPSVSEKYGRRLTAA